MFDRRLQCAVAIGLCAKVLEHAHGDRHPMALVPVDEQRIRAWLAGQNAPDGLMIGIMHAVNHLTANLRIGFRGLSAFGFWLSGFTI